MTAPWMKHRFDYEERERMTQIEDWIAEHEDEIAPRIIYLESLIKNLTDSLNNNLKQQSKSVAIQAQASKDSGGK